MKEYLLDTNIYIDSYDRYYRNEFFPTYWERLSDILNRHVIIPKIVKDEITKKLMVSRLAKPVLYRRLFKPQRLL